jgi:integrase
MASIIKIGNKWRAQVRRKGFEVYTRTFATKTLAAAWAAGIESDIVRGLAPSAQHVAGRRYTVGDAIRDYRALRRSRPILDTSTEHYTLHQLAAGLGHSGAADLRVDDLVGYAQRRHDMGAGPYTVNMDIGKLGTVLRVVSASKGMNLPDVVQQARPLLKHLGLIGGGGQRERRPTEDEMHRIDGYLRAQPNGALYAAATQWAVETAMRQGEIARIRWSDVDAERKLVLVRDRKDPREKAGNDQWVPLLPPAWALLQALPRGEDERIFPIGASSISKAFTAACRALSIPDLHFHDLRHEAISRLFEAGYRIEQVALVSGHKTWTHLRRYTNLRPEDVHKGPGT